MIGWIVLGVVAVLFLWVAITYNKLVSCLLYTSDAADE